MQTGWLAATLVGFVAFAGGLIGAARGGPRARWAGLLAGLGALMWLLALRLAGAPPTAMTYPR